MAVIDEAAQVPTISQLFRASCAFGEYTRALLVQAVLPNSSLVCVTHLGTLMHELRPLQFDVAVVDEAAHV